MDVDVGVHTTVSLFEPTSVSEGTSTPNGSATAAIPLSSVKAVSTYLPYIASARERVTADMEQMVISGLATQVSCS